MAVWGSDRYGTVQTAPDQMTQMTADNLLAREYSDLDPRLREMLNEFPKFREEILPSKYWEQLNKKNLRQISDSSYENFKRTVARNYFTFIVTPWNQQTRFLMRSLPFGQALSIFFGAFFAPRHELFKWYQSLYYDLLTRLLWAYVENNDPDKLLDRLTEPLEGNPPRVYQGDRLISQDLANSFLEYQSVMQADVEADEIRTIMELGSGYGRTAYVYLTLHPDCRYILVDIPPALYVCEKYLSELFEDRKIFHFRPFERYADVSEEYENADIVFLMPHQLELLPKKSVDLFINISSLHEMRMDQIRYYFTVIERLTRQYFYTKQWKETTIPYENVVVREEDYPVREDWRQIYARDCKVQSLFFEALYDLS
jgi:putative sugar O-methyltransferase